MLKDKIFKCLRFLLQVMFSPFYNIWLIVTRKCLYGHNWTYGTEDVTYSQLSNPSKKSILVHKSRYCKTCSKKQIQNIGGEWRNWSLSIDEKRDKNLKELLGI